LPGKARRILVPSSSAGICSVRCPAHGRTFMEGWGDNPPYHADAFVLTHYERDPIVMEGGTTFHFDDGRNPRSAAACQAGGGR
jgi:hypothetical protein